MVNEQMEARYETKIDIDKLPRQVVTRDGFRTLATTAGWHAENIDRLLSGTLPSRFIKVGDAALLLIEEIEFKAEVEAAFSR